MFDQPDIQPNKLQVSQKYILTVFHLFGLYPLFERTNTNVSNRISHYIPSVVIFSLNITLIVFDVINFLERSLTVSSVINLTKSISWNALTAWILTKTMLDPLKFVKVLENINKVDEILWKHLKYEINYEKDRLMLGVKLFSFSFIFLVLTVPYYIYTNNLYKTYILCFEIFADIYNSALLAFFLFYVGLLNDRVKIVFELLTNLLTRKSKIKLKGKLDKDSSVSTLLADLTKMNELYEKLWSITFNINDIFGLFIIIFIVFLFIDLVSLAHFFCNELQDNEIGISLATLSLIVGNVFRLLTVTILTNGLKENASGIGTTIHLFDACTEDDPSLIVLLKDFSSHVLFQPICIESVFFQVDLELLVPVREKKIVINFSYLIFLF